LLRLTETNVFVIESAVHKRVPRRTEGARMMPAGQWLLVYTLKGGAEYRHDDLWHEARPGDVVLLRSGRPLALRVSSAPVWEYIRVRFSAQAWQPPNKLPSVGDGHFRATIEQGATRERVADACSRLVADAQARDEAQVLASLGAADSTETSSAIVAQATSLMRYALQEILLLAEVRPRSKRSVDPRVLRALELMERDLATRHTLGSLARATHLSRSRLGHVFVSEIGISPMASLQLLRLRQAALRLRDTDDLIGTIAVDTGFGSDFHFSRQFRRHYGLSPRAYRLRHRT
jgi:AraC family transcriptional regulator, arabinose operon regulatory protein